MTHLPHKQFRKRLIFTVVAVLITVGVLSSIYIFYKQQLQSPSITKQPAIPSAKPNPTDRLIVKPHNHDPGTEQHGINGIQTSDESAGSAAFPTTQPNLAVEIIDIRQVNSLLISDTIITPKANGSCILELTRADNTTLKKTTSLTANMDDTSRCTDTTIDAKSVMRGEWSLTVKVQVNSNVATATKTITLK